MSFLDQQWTTINGEKVPYAPIRYKEIVKECYLIAKNSNIPYLDLMKITPKEKEFFIEFMLQEVEQNEKIIEDAQKRINDSNRR